MAPIFLLLFLLFVALLIIGALIYLLRQAHAKTERLEQHLLDSARRENLLESLVNPNTSDRG